MTRRDSLESTAAVLDACILDLTRRRRSTMGGMSSNNDMGPPLGAGLGVAGQLSSESGLQSALAARQHQLRMQQAELEKRQQELELQRQQLIAGLQDTSTQPTLSGIPSQQPYAPPMGSYPPAMNDNMPLPHEEEVLGALDSTGPNPNQSQQWWVCQICNSKAFASRREATDHEAVCDVARQQQNRLEMQREFQPEYHVNPETLGMITRPLCLAMPTDKDWLTPLHCFVRRHCVEVFTACADDVAHPAKGKRKPIQVGQVGIRCPFCHVPGDPNNRERGSVYYPTTISSIYNATMNLLQRHLHSCPSVPDNIMEQYQTLKGDDARSGTSKKYWVESSLSLGLVDTPSGIRYSNLEPPPLPQLSFHQQTTSSNKTRDTADDLFTTKSNASPDTPPKDGEEGSTTEKVLSTGPSGSEVAPAALLVEPEDKPYATQFSYELLCQMQPCVFTEADRLGKRKGLPAGYAGLACRHCFGGYGSGRFFPSSIKTLSDTSKTLNVLHNHMLKCRKCPPDVKNTLEKYRVHHDDERAKMKFGSQKAFFARIWARLHGDNNPGIPRSQTSGAKRNRQQAQYSAGPPMKQEPTFGGGYNDMSISSIMGMGGLDVLSRQAASAAPEGSPSKRARN